YGGTVEKLDLKTRQTRSVDPTLADPDIYRHTWTLPLAFNAVNKDTLYFGNQRLWQTTDGGEHWTAISPDLSRPDPAVPSNLDAPTVANNLHQGPRRGVFDRFFAVARETAVDRHRRRPGLAHRRCRRALEQCHAEAARRVVQGR